MKVMIVPLALASTLALSTAADAQIFRVKDKPAAKKQDKSVEKQAYDLLKIAKQLRAAGSVDVAAAVEALAKNLMGQSKTAEKKRAAQARPDAAPRPDAASRPDAPPRPDKKRFWAGKPVRERKAVAGAASQKRRIVRYGEGPEVMVVPKGDGDVWRKVSSKEHLPPPDAARVDTGRRVFRYVPTATKRDDKGNVTWRGLPTEPQAAPRARADGDLAKRVKALSAEVAEMRALLEKLNEQIAKERRGRLIR